MRGCHAGDPRDGETPSVMPAAPSPPPTRADGLTRWMAVGGVQEAVDVRRRRGGPEPAALVRLVPDQPALHERVVRRRRCREGAEAGAAEGGPVLGPAAVRPGRGADERGRARSPLVQAVDDRVVAAPLLKTPRLGRTSFQATFTRTRSIPSGRAGRAVDRASRGRSGSRRRRGRRSGHSATRRPAPRPGLRRRGGGGEGCDGGEGAHASRYGRALSVM